MMKKVIAQISSGLKTAYPILLTSTQRDELVQKIISLEKDGHLKGNIVAIRSRSFDDNHYNISIECTGEHIAQQLQRHLAEYLDSAEGRHLQLKATVVGSYVDMMTSPGEYYGKGVSLFQVFQFHPTIPKENIVIIDDSAQRGGNGVPMMVDEKCQCFCVGPGEPAFKHIQTKVNGESIQGQYAEGTLKILKLIYQRILKGELAGNKCVFLLDVDSTLTMKGEAGQEMPITTDVKDILIDLIKVGAHIYLSTARGMDLLHLQEDFFKTLPQLNIGLFMMNGTHYTSGEDLRAICQYPDGKRDFSRLKTRYQKHELHRFNSA